MSKVSSDTIVAAARELFRERGYSGASMQDLADMVGIRKASLYSRFPDKEALIARVLELTHAELFSSAVQEVDWRAAFRVTIDSLAEHVRTHRRCVAMHLAYGLGGEAQPPNVEVRRFFDACRERFAAILRRGMDEQIADEIAVDTIVRIEGATLWLALYNDQGPLERAVAEVIARAEAATAKLPDEQARRLLDEMGGDWRRSTAVERALAVRLAETHERALLVEQALRGEIDAESCFL